MFADNTFCSRASILSLQGNLGFVYNDPLIKWPHATLWMEMNTWAFEWCLMLLPEAFELYSPPKQINYCPYIGLKYAQVWGHICEEHEECTAFLIGTSHERSQSFSLITPELWLFMFHSDTVEPQSFHLPGLMHRDQDWSVRTYETKEEILEPQAVRARLLSQGHRWLQSEFRGSETHSKMETHYLKQDKTRKREPGVCCHPSWLSGNIFISNMDMFF